MARILIVEDEMDIANITKNYLEKEGHTVTLIADGSEALRFFLSNSADLLILDIMLPSVDGLIICETVRKKNNIPIIIISAAADEESRIMGLNLGADDYLVKPYSVKELAARARAQIRRSLGGGFNVELSDGDLRLNIVSKQVTGGGVPLQMTVKEFDLLKLFLENRNRVLYKDYILNTVWGTESESEPSTLTVHINKLREKIETNPKSPKRIVTVWGQGYRYEGCS